MASPQGIQGLEDLGDVGLEADDSRNVVIGFYSVLQELKDASDSWDYERAEEKRKELERVASQLRKMLEEMEEEKEIGRGGGGEKKGDVRSNVERTLDVYEKIRPKARVVLAQDARKEGE
jgi:hypothetical protein